MTFPALLAGGFLALWGVAIELCWASTQRLINHYHNKLALRGWMRPPARLYAPIEHRTDLGLTFTALAAGNAALLAFASSSIATLRLPTWLDPLTAAPWLALLRIACAMSVLLFFLTQVCEHPRWKLVWAAGWTVFSLSIASLA